MDREQKNEILMEIAPYISDIEFFKEILNNCNSIENLKNELNKLYENEEEITKKTDIKIILEKL